MNRILADFLSALNVLIAILMVAVAAKFGEQIVGGLGGILLGGAIGLAFASLYCGIIAFLALIEHHLRVLAESGGMQRRAGGAGSRIDPSL